MPGVGSNFERNVNRREVRPALTDESRAARRRRHPFVQSYVHMFCDDCGLSPAYPIHNLRLPR